MGKKNMELIMRNEGANLRFDIVNIPLEELLYLIGGHAEGRMRRQITVYMHQLAKTAPLTTITHPIMF